MAVDSLVSIERSDGTNSLAEALGLVALENMDSQSWSTSEDLWAMV